MDGYIFDFSRSAVVGGKATPEQKELTEVAAARVEIGLEEARLGIRASEWVKKIETRLDQIAYLKPSMTGAPAGFYGYRLGLAMEASRIQPWPCRVSAAALASRTSWLGMKRIASAKARRSAYAWAVSISANTLGRCFPLIPWIGRGLVSEKRGQPLENVIFPRRSFNSGPR